jgi:hypothetical protein
VHKPLGQRGLAITLTDSMALRLSGFRKVFRCFVMNSDSMVTCAAIRTQNSPFRPRYGSSRAERKAAVKRTAFARRLETKRNDRWV